jgi:hypothetical protein
LIRIFLRKLHHHTSRRSDDLPSQKYVLQSERLDLLPVFCFPCEVHLEQQKQIVSQHHQLKDHFIILYGTIFFTSDFNIPFQSVVFLFTE